jgi:hypothetical protein
MERSSVPLKYVMRSPPIAICAAVSTGGKPLNG